MLMYIHQEAEHTLMLRRVYCTNADFDTFFPLVMRWWGASFSDGEKNTSHRHEQINAIIVLLFFFSVYSKAKPSTCFFKCLAEIGEQIRAH